MKILYLFSMITYTLPIVLVCETRNSVYDLSTKSFSVSILNSKLCHILLKYLCPMKMIDLLWPTHHSIAQVKRLSRHKTNVS